MYKIFITENCTQEIYADLIDFAFIMSDAFMIIVFRISDDLELVYNSPSRELFDSEELYQLVIKSNEKRKMEADKDAKILVQQ